MRNEKKAPARVQDFCPKSADMAENIRRIAANTSLVFFSDHAIDRMEERDITRPDAIRVLRSGRIVGDITPGRSPGEWKCKVVAKLKGNRGRGCDARPEQGNPPR